MTKREWYDYPRRGSCDVCARRAWRQAHHAVMDQKIPTKYHYDVRNRMLVCVSCHMSHTQYGVNDGRMPLAKVPQAAREFAVEVLGPGPAEGYFRRYYQ